MTHVPLRTTQLERTQNMAWRRTEKVTARSPGAGPLSLQAERELESEVIPHKTNSFKSPGLASIRSHKKCVCVDATRDQGLGLPASD